MRHFLLAAAATVLLLAVPYGPAFAQDLQVGDTVMLVERDLDIPAHSAPGMPRAADGTAVAAFAGFDLANWPVAGKTGTAEIDGKEDTSVFVAFGPNRGAAQTPEYVVGAILEEAGFGADVAAPLVRRIMDPLRDRSSLPKAVAVTGCRVNSTTSISIVP